MPITILFTKAMFLYRPKPGQYSNPNIVNWPSFIFGTITVVNSLTL